MNIEQPFETDIYACVHVFRLIRIYLKPLLQSFVHNSVDTLMYIILFCFQIHKYLHDYKSSHCTPLPEAKFKEIMEQIIVETEIFN